MLHSLEAAVYKNTGSHKLWWFKADTLQVMLSVNELWFAWGFFLIKIKQK